MIGWFLVSEGIYLNKDGATSFLMTHYSCQMRWGIVKWCIRHFLSLGDTTSEDKNARRLYCTERPDSHKYRLLVRLSAGQRALLKVSWHFKLDVFLYWINMLHNDGIFWLHDWMRGQLIPLVIWWVRILDGGGLYTIFVVDCMLSRKLENTI